MNLLDLPSEITHSIYSYLFASHLVIITASEELDAGNIRDVVDITGWDELIHLFLTCKQIYRSVRPYLKMVTVRVDVISHYHSSYLQISRRPHLTNVLVPAVKHVWSCMSRLTNLEDRSHTSNVSSSAPLPNFQICFYDSMAIYEQRSPADLVATILKASKNPPYEIGIYPEKLFGSCATTTTQRLTRLKPSMSEVVFTEVFVVFDLVVYGDEEFLDHEPGELVRRDSFLFRSGY
ncbi:hypothetical protein PMZ80_005544 [Knufia obscura]|uniref:Uncharacterized protein n=2 Tax=Knufia TaxID=430999 RepID=A0AAN8EAF2_9EURO|nr:hypothetical protein PMZ80_005544 [Knufia obscura]KAK5950013.1 hypothetical protein OHC33_008974 [Knufia fluminis]